MLLLILTAAFLILAFYSFYMLKLALAWYMQREVTAPEKIQHIFITVIVPVRNEEHRISGVLSSLLAQDMPASGWELIVSDDGSDDGTVKVADAFRNKFENKNVAFRIIIAGANDKNGKKGALERAIQASNGNYILTTDADTKAAPGWIRSVAACFSQTHAAMVVPLTELDPSGGFWNAMQAIEFAGLTASACASIAAGRPLMCNGANLAFSKPAFYRAGGYGEGQHIASGDDTFLMLSLHRSQPGSVVFLKDRQAVVTASPATTLKEFIHQRVRWISKVKHYADRGAVVTGSMVSLANLVVLMLFAAWVTENLSGWIPLVAFLMKSSGEFLLLKQALAFLNRRRLLFLFLPAALLTPVYFFISGWFLLLPSRFEWKGRSYKA
jgi:cellulose synthase/poly-beta-1,6-N-acetylglucosamine synthase-like glycosyltransferase